MHDFNRKFTATTAVAIFAIGASSQAHAKEWDWALVPYLWGSDVSADVFINDEPVIGGDLEFSDILDKLDMALQLHFEGRRGKGGLFFDLTYLDTSDSSVREANPPLPGGTEVRGDTTLFFVEAGGFYRPSGESFGFDVLFGARISDIDMTIDIIRPDPLPPSSVNAADTLTDGFVGVRYSTSFANNWLFSIRGDVGAGDSETSWNAVALLGYSFGRDNRYAAMFGYRHLYMELETTDTVTVRVETTMSGPMAGFMFRF